MMAFAQLHAARTFDLTELTSGTFAAENLKEVQPLFDGETYTQISSDGHQILKYSFKTGERVAVLFEIANARGAELDACAGYIISPDGRRLLIHTNAQHMYRHAFTATY